MPDQVAAVREQSMQRDWELRRREEHRRQRERVARSLVVGRHSLRDVYPRRRPVVAGL